jgi:hypothetical protein
MFPRVEQQERRAGQIMILEKTVKVSNISQYVHIIKVTEAKYVGFEVLRAVIIKNFIFWDIPLCS